MELFKTVDTATLLRIEEDGGAAITVYVEGTTGQILSLYVPEEDRSEGIGKALLFAAEQELKDTGIYHLEAHYFDGLKDITAFFYNCGFEITSGAPILSVDVKDLLEAPEVKKMFATDISTRNFIPLSEHSIEQWDGLLDRFLHYHIHVEDADLARMEQNLSGVVYDGEGNARALVLCSETKDGILVELLMEFLHAEPKYVLMALYGMLVRIEKQGGADAYDNVLMIAVNPKVNALLKKILGKSKKPSRIGRTVNAAKNLEETPLDELPDEELDEDLDEDMEEEWRREIRKIPAQANINYKLSALKARLGSER